jgi:hypothetical protein
MRTVIKTGPGEVQLNWMWLPTFIGMDTNVKKELEGALSKRLVGLPLDEATLDMAHEEVLDFLDKRYPGLELRTYLDGLKFIPAP